MDVTAVSRRARGDAGMAAADGLHPSGKMYGVWVETILPTARVILSL